MAKFEDAFEKGWGVGDCRCYNLFGFLKSREHALWNSWQFYCGFSKSFVKLGMEVDTAFHAEGNRIMGLH
jgi:hypothetical protein